LITFKNHTESGKIILKQLAKILKRY